MSIAPKPTAKPILPTITDLNKPFWDGCKNGRFLLQHCSKCGFKRYPAAPVRPKCLSVEASWEPASGRGELFSFVVFQRAYHPAWEGMVPYNVSLVELEEGPIVLCNVVGIKNEDLKVGMKLMPAYETLPDGTAIPVFKPTSD